jgi:hypothetical protein
MNFAADSDLGYCEWEQARLAERNKGSRQQTKFCLNVVIEHKQTILQYQPVKSRPFLRVVVATPNLVTQARGKFLPFTPTMADTSVAPAVPPPEQYSGGSLWTDCKA